MRTITFTILAEDIIKNSYFGADSCPITRGLKRAGYDDLQDVGFICGTLNGECIGIDTENEDYKKALNKMFGMYNSKLKNNYELGINIKPIPIEDFDITINY